jgi:hypothetical protein
MDFGNAEGALAYFGERLEHGMITVVRGFSR